MFIAELVDTTDVTARAVAEFFATLDHVSLSRWLCCKPELLVLYIDKNKLSATHNGIFATQKNKPLKDTNDENNNGNSRFGFLPK